MPCYRPLTGYRSADLTKNGKRKIVFGSGGYQDLPVQVPCGQCIGCRLERSRQWAVRISHECQLHEFNSFVTLTYDNLHVPLDGGLVKKHFQDFMKRLRIHMWREYGQKVRYYMCGEYGETNRRPHYHAVLFGCDFPDKRKHTTNGRGETLFTSATLTSLWGKGFCLIGAVTFESAAYVARYVTKKVLGTSDEAESQRREKYSAVDSSSGELIPLLPEFTMMSLKPGIGDGWYEKFKGDVFPSDFLTVRGKKQLPPRRYMLLKEKEDPDGAVKIKFKRIRRASSNKADNTPERLRVREEVRLARTSQLKRSL